MASADRYFLYENDFDAVIAITDCQIDKDDITSVNVEI